MKRLFIFATIVLTSTLLSAEAPVIKSVVPTVLYCNNGDDQTLNINLAYKSHITISYCNMDWSCADERIDVGIFRSGVKDHENIYYVPYVEPTETLPIKGEDKPYHVSIGANAFGYRPENVCRDKKVEVFIEGARIQNCYIAACN